MWNTDEGKGSVAVMSWRILLPPSKEPEASEVGGICVT